MKRNGDLHALEAVPARLLAELLQHRPVILVAHHRLGSRLEVDAVDHRAQRLRGVARDDDLVRRAPGQIGELPLDAGVIRRLPPPHVERQAVVDGLFVALERVPRGHRLRTRIPVLEVDVVRVRRERLAHLAPERLFRGGRGRRQALVRFEPPLEGVEEPRAEHGGRGPGDSGPHERPA
jgi:hypothetical protein